MKSVGSRAIGNVLKSVDWSFSGPFKGGRPGQDLFDARKFHWYPATFIPEIPYTLIDVISNRGDLIYDPFAGIGTTSFQAAMLGRRPITSDICRIGIAVARDLWELLRPSNVLPDPDALVGRIIRGFDYASNYESRLGGEIEVNEVRRWYHSDTFQQLAYLKAVTHDMEDDVAAAAFRVALSANYKTLSGQGRGWGCVADNMIPKSDQLDNNKNAFLRVQRHLNVLLREIRTIRETLCADARDVLNAKRGDEVFHLMDVRNEVPVSAGSVDLIVTSPPYPEMTDYSTSQRLSYYWEGRDPEADVVREIGARRKRFRKASLPGYASDMRTALSNVIGSLRVGGYACFVMPLFEARVIPERRDVVDRVMDHPLSAGCELVDKVTRVLPTRRRHHNQNWTSLDKEVIYIFRRSS
jgi:hypothetical protein